MRAGVIVRHTIRRDIEQIAGMLDAGDGVEECLLEEMRSPCVVCKTAVLRGNDEEVVGCVSYRIGKIPTLAITRLGVHPDHRRKGIGTALLGELIRRMSVDRWQFLKVCMNERNMGGLLFLRASGFKARKVLRGRFGDDDGFEMALSLHDVWERANRYAMASGVC